MPAKDYKICPALFKAYIAKVSKRNPNQMTEDRREITENEIMGLIDWWLDMKTEEDEPKDGSGQVFKSFTREGRKIEVLWGTLKSDKKDEK